MITNPGFTFVGVSGQHKLVPTSQTDLPIWGPQYEQAILCTYDGELVTVYDKGPGYSNIEEKSVAMQFAAIDPNDTDTIIAFCNKYGMPGAMRQEGNFRNDYLFFNETKDNFSKSVPLGTPRERTWLFDIQRNICCLKNTLLLNQAITEENFERIIEIVFYFCFDLSGLDFEGSKRSTETYEFNHYFHRYSESNGYDKMLGTNNLPWNDYVIGFLDDIYADYCISESFHSHGASYPSKYTQIYHSLWQGFDGLARWVLAQTSITDISPYGTVTFSKPLSELDQEILNRDKVQLLNVAKGVLSDIFKEKLNRVYPEIVFNKSNQPESSWRIPSLLDAMYLEIFFSLTPNSSVKHCANPDCSEFFTWSASKQSRIYCSVTCANNMAQRMRRARLKKQKNNPGQRGEK